MARAKLSNPTRDPHPRKNGARHSQIRTTKPGQLERLKPEETQTVRKKKGLRPKRKRKQTRLAHFHETLSHLLTGMVLAAGSLVVYWLHSPSYVEGLVIVLDVAWVLQHLTPIKFETD